MEQPRAEAHDSVYKLADHLDAVLAAIEDLNQLTSTNADPVDVLCIELSMITHALQARQCIYEVLAGEVRLYHHTALFLAGTEPLIDPKCEATCRGTATPITDAYLVGQRMPIGLLAKHAGRMLDALECYYVLYEDPENAAAPAHTSYHAAASPVPPAMPSAI